MSGTQVPTSMFVEAAVLCARGIARGIPRNEVLETVGHGLVDACGPEVGAFMPGMLAAWAENGLPTIEVSHRLAASLACTSISKEAASALNLPWRCFRIHVPAGVFGDEPTNAWVLSARTGGIRTVTFWGQFMDVGFENGLPDLADCSFVDTANDDEDPGAFEFDREAASRKSLLLGRLILGLCAELDAPHTRDQIGDRAKRLLEPRTGPPKIWVTKVTRSVAFDLRPAVLRYLSGASGGTLSLQHVVRGHWKRQPHGAGRTARKWIHVEPYWRGDMNSPIAVNHKVL